MQPVSDDAHQIVETATSTAFDLLDRTQILKKTSKKDAILFDANGAHIGRFLLRSNTMMLHDANGSEPVIRCSLWSGAPTTIQDAWDAFCVLFPSIKEPVHLAADDLDTYRTLLSAACHLIPLPGSTDALVTQARWPDDILEPSRMPKLLLFDEEGESLVNPDPVFFAKLEAIHTLYCPRSATVVKDWDGVALFQSELLEIPVNPTPSVHERAQAIRTLRTFLSTDPRITDGIAALLTEYT